MTYRTWRESRAMRPKDGMRKLWTTDPRGALELMFIECEEQGRWASFMNVSLQDRRGTTYGGYQDIKREDLVGRRFIVNYWDCAIGVMFVDVWFAKTIARSSTNVFRLPHEVPELYSPYYTPQGAQPVLTLEPP